MTYEQALDVAAEALDYVLMNDCEYLSEETVNTYLEAERVLAAGKPEEA